MSQAGPINVVQNNPSIPTQFDANTGFAVPIGNILNVVGNATQGVSTSASGSTLTITVANATTASKGVAQFDPANFTVTAGVVSLTAGGPFVTSVSGTANRITSTGGATPVIDIAATYVGQTSITTLGTIVTGMWNGTVIGPTFGGTGLTTYTTGDILYASAANTLSKLVIGSNGQVLTLAAGIPSWATPTTGTVTSVSGTANRITSTGGATPVIDISASYVGQSSITTLGTITTGVWNGTTIDATHGGTAQTTYATGDILYASGVNTLTKLAAGSNTNVLTLAGGVPTWAAPATSGTVTSVSGTANQVAVANGTTTPVISLIGPYTPSTLTGLLTGNGTSSIVGTAINQYSVITGGATNLPNSVAPSATAGNPLVSAGSSSQPIFSATPTVTSITISNAPVSGTDGANKTYVDNAITAVNPATSVVAATTANLNATYLNGVSGVGATLTNAGALAAFTIDGQTPTLNQRVLVKDQTSTFQNGVYTVSTLGSGAIAWILTRASDYNQPSDINSTGVINVLNGTVNALTGWLINSTVTTIGTDPITYVKYNNAPSTVTQYAVLVGGANNLISSVGPTSTAGQYLQSAGNAANPAFSTATLPSTATGTGTILRADGTNWVATTTTYPNTNAINTLLYASSANVMSALATANNGVHVTNSTGVPSVLAGPGTTGNILQSNAAAAPSFSTATYPSSSGGTGKILYDNGTNFVESTPTFPASASASSGKIIISDGTNWIASTPTYPNTSGTAGKVVISDGTNNVYSTPTFPNASATTGKFIQSDGTNWIASTPTIPATAGTSGKVLVSDGTNFVSSTPTFPNASATSRKIIVSDGTNWIASTETYAVPGTSGNILTSDGTNWTSAAPAAGSGVTVATGTATSAQIKAAHATPIQLIAAQGAGKTILVVYASFKMNYGGTNAFTAAGGQTLDLYYGTTNEVCLGVQNAGLTSTTSNLYAAAGTNGVPISAVALTATDNKAVNLYNTSVTEIAGNAANNNTITWAVAYYVQ